MATVLTGSRAEVILQPGKISQFRLAYIGGVTAVTVVAALGYTPANTENAATVPTGPATLNIIHQLNFFRDARNWTGFDLTGSAHSNVAMQNVANFCRDTGERVTFPPALIRLTEQIEFEERSSITGPRWPGVYDPAKAFWLHFDHIGQGLYFGGVAGSHQLENVGFLRTQPNPGAGWAPTDYGWDIEGFTQDLHLRNVMHLRSTRGVKSTGIARFHLENVRGQVFKQGIEFESNYDTCTTQNVHYYPFWSQDANVKAYMLANFDAIYTKRNDNPFFSNIFSIWHRRGVRFGYFAGASGRAAGVTYKAKFVNCDLDLGTTGIEIDAAADAVTAEFHALSIQGRDDSASFADALVNVLGTNARLALVQANLREGGGNLIRAQGSGNIVSVNGLEAGAFNKTGGGWPAIEPTAGNTITLDGQINASTALTYANTGTVLTPDWRAFTPTYTATTSGPPTVTGSVARYRMTSKRLEFMVQGTISALNGSTGDLNIAGLPAANNSGGMVAVQAMAENTPAVLVARVGSAASTIRVSANGGGFPAAGTQFRVWGAYETA